jgi:hypothetical protein
MFTKPVLDASLDAVEPGTLVEISNYIPTGAVLINKQLLSFAAFPSIDDVFHN